MAIREPGKAGSGHCATRSRFTRLARLTLGSEPELALASFLQAGAIYRDDPETQLQAAHISMQLAAFALSAGQPDVAAEIVDRNLPRGRRRGERGPSVDASHGQGRGGARGPLGRGDEAEGGAPATASAGARYGFGTEAEVRSRAREIAALRPDLRGDRT